MGTQCFEYLGCFPTSLLEVLRVHPVQDETQRRESRKQRLHKEALQGCRGMHEIHSGG